MKSLVLTSLAVLSSAVEPVALLTYLVVIGFLYVWVHVVSGKVRDLMLSRDQHIRGGTREDTLFCSPTW